jgi:hypothetical protein
MKKFLLYLSMVCVLHAKAQVKESFTDGNFTTSPKWIGDTSLYSINASFQLQSNGTTATSGEVSSLAIACSLSGEIVWQFYTKFNLSPSTQNYCRFYLMSDQADLKGNLNGYYVQFGGSTGSTDSISLFKQTGSQRIRLIAGRPGTVSKNSNIVTIKVSKNAQGFWTLLSDTSGGNNFILEGTASDNTYPTMSFCGVSCRYTSTNIKAFYFDDIDIYSGVDTTPPTFDSLKVVNATKINLVFSETLDKISAEDINNYTANNGLGKPQTAVQDLTNKNKVTLTYASNFQTGVIYSLNVTNIKDAAGNTMKPAAKIFSFGGSGNQTIIINEIMSDPTPVVGLPDFEYIELYNPNNTSIDLSNWTITDGTTTSTFTTTFGSPIIPADSFIILCPVAAVSQFSAIGNTAILSSFPSLNNTGDLITLKDDLGNTRAQVAYDLSWFKGNIKSNGGWSIELVNPFSKCGGTSNWKAAENSLGGTPGSKNSVWNVFTDTIAPNIKNIIYLDSQTIQIIFTEATDTNALLNASINMSGGLNIFNRIVSKEGDTLIFNTNLPMTHQQIYTLTISGVKDCESNSKILQPTFTYLKLINAAFGGLVIDEIYASPQANRPIPNAEWIEIHNNSTNPIKLTKYILTDGTTNAVFPESVIMPDSFAIVCHINNFSSMSAFGKVIGLSNFPSLNNDGDLLTLSNPKGEKIHSVAYDVTWFENSYKKNGGWSLEMIDYTNVCNGASNWKASINNDGATPGKNNSIYKSNPDQTNPQLLRLYPSSQNQLVLYFSESIDTILMQNISNYKITPSVSSIVSATTNIGDASQIILTFSDSFARNQVYELEVVGLADCWGNTLTDNKASFGMPQEAEIGDIVINELLFNPSPFSTDFVELYNNSNKTIDLSQLIIANCDELGNIKDFANISAYLFMPKTYVALSANQVLVKKEYQTPNPADFIDIASFPSYNDDKGTVVIMNIKNNELDRFSYNASMHHQTLVDKESISLERVDYTRSILEETNWQSAATTVKATPAYQNSQFNGNNIATNTMSLEPEVFSPDDDGYNDILNINYQMPDAGYQGEVMIYSTEGALVKKLTKQQLLGVTGTFSWNGINDQGKKSSIGVYIVVFQYFNLKGNVKMEKKTVTLAGKL